VTPKTGDISDGYHTFDELYEHRHALFLALARRIAGSRPDRIWRSKLHHDGSSFTGWFIMGIDRLPGEQVTYHLPMRFWDGVEFAIELDRAPEWDGHSSVDVLARLERL
jgi:hypothetical protein